ncbi:MAG: hypothetical protein ABIR57_15345 [Aeromicrobium sp.]
MNPWPALFGQSAAAGLALELLASIDSRPFDAIAFVMILAYALGAMGLATSYAYALLRGRAQSLKSSAADGSRRDPRRVLSFGGPIHRTPWRKRRDNLVAAEVLWVAIAPLTLLGLRHEGILSSWGESIWVTNIGILFVGLSTLLTIVFVSSLIDWFYVRPRRDGLVCLPPCWEPANERWYRVTRTWIRHRMIADLAFATFFPVTGIAIIFSLGSEGSVGSWVSRVVGFIFTLCGLATKYAWPRVKTGMTAVSNSGLTFHVGQTIGWRLREQDRPGSPKMRELKLFGLTAHFGVGRTYSIPSDEFWEGSGGFVFDVSTKESKILRARSKHESSGIPSESLPVAGLLKEGAVTDRRETKYCGHKSRGGGCRQLHDECERDPSRHETPK